MFLPSSHTCQETFSLSERQQRDKVASGQVWGNPSFRRPEEQTEVAACSALTKPSILPCIIHSFLLHKQHITSNVETLCAPCHDPLVLLPLHWSQLCSALSFHSGFYPFTYTSISVCVHMAPCVL